MGEFLYNGNKIPLSVHVTDSGISLPYKHDFETNKFVFFLLEGATKGPRQKKHKPSITNCDERLICYDGITTPPPPNPFFL